MARFRDVLKERNFFLLWLGQVISQFGDRLDHMALIGLVYAKAPGSTLQLAKLLSFTIIPLVIFGPIAGAYVDRWDRKKTLIVCDILRGLLVVAIPLSLFFTKAILPVYCIVFCVFAIGCLYIPARLSIIPSLVQGEKLLLANSISTTSSVVAAFMGFAIGGVLVEFVGTNGAFFIDAGTYLVSAILIFGIKPSCAKVSETAPACKPCPIKNSILRDVKDGLLYLKGRRDARFVTNVMVLLMGAVGCIYAVGVVFVQESLHTVTLDLSVIGLFLGMGFFVGSVLYGKFGQKLNKAKTMSFGLCATGILICAFASALKFYTSYFVVWASALGLGAAVAPVVVSSNTLIHEITQDGLRGRIFTLLGALMSASMLVFMFLTAYLAEWIHRAWILFGTGAIVASFGPWAAFHTFAAKKPHPQGRG